MARMIGAWIWVLNPNRALNEVLNLQVGGTIGLTPHEFEVASGQLFNIRVKVVDDDAVFDNVLMTDNSTSVSTQGGLYHSFSYGLLVPAATLRASEPTSEHYTEIYCRISARAYPPGHPAIATNWATTNTLDNILI